MNTDKITRIKDASISPKNLLMINVGFSNQNTSEESMARLYSDLGNLKLLTIDPRDFLHPTGKSPTQQLADGIKEKFTQHGRKLDGIIIDITVRHLDPDSAKSGEKMNTMRSNIVRLIREIRQNGIKEDSDVTKIPPETVDEGALIVVQGAQQTPSRIKNELGLSKNMDIAGKILCVGFHDKRSDKKVYEFLQGAVPQKEFR